MVTTPPCREVVEVKLGGAVENLLPCRKVVEVKLGSGEEDLPPIAR